MLMMNVANDRDITHKFEEFVRDAGFPCVGAKSALNKGQMHFVVADDICSAWDDLRILPHISALAKHYRETPELFQTLVVIFREIRKSDRAPVRARRVGSPAIAE